MKRVFVDTSAWYAYARGEDPDHKTVSKALEEWENRLVSSNFVFDEVITLVRMRLGYAAAVRVGETLQSQEVVDLVSVLPEDEEAAWAWFKKSRDKAYSYTDCTSFALMRRLHIPVAIATGHHFGQAGFEAIPVVSK